MAYTELTVWTRGIIMDKEGRDIVNSIAASARLEGKFAQAMENYVDNPDRTNAPTRKYCRISDHEIENALTYENEQPNILVLVEQTMVKGWDYMRGMPPGGTLVINTHYTPEYMLRFVPGPERLSQLVCVDAAKLADHKWLYYRLGELGLDRLSTEGAAERSKAIAPDIAAPLIAAVVKTTGIVKIETIEPMIANKAAFNAALESLQFCRSARQSRRPRHSCRQKAHIFRIGCRFRSRASRRRRRRRDRICFPPATGARSGRCIATRCRRATTRAGRTKRSRAIWIW